LASFLADLAVFFEFGDGGLNGGQLSLGGFEIGFDELLLSFEFLSVLFGDFELFLGLGKVSFDELPGFFGSFAFRLFCGHFALEVLDFGLESLFGELEFFSSVFGLLNRSVEIGDLELQAFLVGLESRLLLGPVVDLVLERGDLLIDGFLLGIQGLVVGKGSVEVGSITLDVFLELIEGLLD